MSLQEPPREDDVNRRSAVVLGVPPVSAHIETLVEAIRTEDADRIASTLDQLEKIQGPAAAFTINSALEVGGLTKAALLSPLKKRAKTLQTAPVWSQLAGVALEL